MFETIAAATTFLEMPQFDFSGDVQNFIYEITYTDGTEFERMLETLDQVKMLHCEIERLAAHMGALTG